jgi:hypothetical protein
VALVVQVVETAAAAEEAAAEEAQQVLPQLLPLSPSVQQTAPEPSFVAARYLALVVLALPSQGFGSCPCFGLPAALRPRP